MLIPYGTDAPLYHYPIATLGTIVVNVLVQAFVMTLSEEQQDEWLPLFILQYGHFNPLQWLTSNYLHAGIMHLLGNMFCLWGFGLVVEGKIGWWKMLLVYNGIGIAECAVEQTLMLGFSEGGSLGASAAIFGLMAMCLVWAPQNEMNCVVMLGFRPWHFDASIKTLVGCAVFLEIATQSLAMLSLGEGIAALVTSQVLHLAGASLGAGIAVLMLKKGWVDCEGWDLISVWHGKHLQSAEEKAIEERQTPEFQAREQSRLHEAVERFRGMLAEEKSLFAWSAIRSIRREFPTWQPTQEEYFRLLAQLQKQAHYKEALEAMRAYLSCCQERAGRVRLAMAQLLVDQFGRPGQGLRVLASLDPSQLSPAEQAAAEKLKRRAEKKREEDPYEAVEDW